MELSVLVALCSWVAPALGEYDLLTPKRKNPHSGFTVTATSHK